ncbi:MAG TPA: Uma2 family endonuclease [Thiolinea sp.]|nr:Uma2 family endonuclease [Thiolinea sp.]
MFALVQHTAMRVEEYLIREQDAPFRSEFVQGEVFAMAGAGDAHVTVTGNLFALLRSWLRGRGCRAYASDMKVRIGTDTAYCYPDILVTCEPEDHQRNYFKQAPVLIVEVLSASTEAYDRGGKFVLYRQLKSLQEYVLIDPRVFRVDVFRRNAQERWELFSFEGADSELELASINFHTAMPVLYEDVDFSLAHGD